MQHLMTNDNPKAFFCFYLYLHVGVCYFMLPLSGRRHQQLLRNHAFTTHSSSLYYYCFRTQIHFLVRFVELDFTHLSLLSLSSPIKIVLKYAYFDSKFKCWSWENCLSVTVWIHFWWFVVKIVLNLLTLQSLPQVTLVDG